MENKHEVRLTQYSHGAGCGCKLSPKVLDEILAQCRAFPDDGSTDLGRLLVGNSARDDAAVFDMGNGLALISTTDFFMPIVDDPYTFGRIAAANAISDVYAMGGRPVLAIGILGWPINKLPASVAGRVVDGGRSMCSEAGITLAGGHSIDSPEPIFGLAVNGLVDPANLKRNDTAQAGDVLFLTKRIGIGMLTTAEKKGVLRDEDQGKAAAQMMSLNTVGAELAKIAAVHAMTDVTGFGLLGHLGEMCEGSNVHAEIDFAAVPRLSDLDYYLAAKSIPGGTTRNYESYNHNVGELTEAQRALLCDPQTSGGLLVAVDPVFAGDVQAVLTDAGLGDMAQPIGTLGAPTGKTRIVVK